MDTSKEPPGSSDALSTKSQGGSWETVSGTASSSALEDIRPSQVASGRIRHRVAAQAANFIPTDHLMKWADDNAGAVENDEEFDKLLYSCRMTHPGASLFPRDVVTSVGEEGEVARAQRRVGRILLVLGTIFFVPGGYVLLDSMRGNGHLARDAMVQVSSGLGLPVVGVVGEAERAMAAKIWAWGVAACAVVVAGVVVVLVWAIVIFAK